MSGSDTVADLVIARLGRDGIDTVFSVTGGGVMYLVDAIARSRQVRLISTHHEEYAGVAADGYARSGKPYGVAIGTTGPGAAQLFPAIAAAYQDSSPVLFLVGQVKTADSSAVQGLDLRQNGTFEFDTRAAFGSVSKYHAVVTTPEEIDAQLELALKVARDGRPGPVVLEIPLDIQGARVGHVATLVDQRLAAEPIDTEPARAALDDALRSSRRPLVLLGVGAVRSVDYAALTDVLVKAGIPYVTTQFARQAGRADHDLFLGSPGIKANRSANLAICSADLVIIIGSSLHQQVIGWESQAFADLPSRKMWFEIDPAVRAARSGLVDDCFSLPARDAADLLTTVVSSLDGPDWGAWQKSCRDLRAAHLLHYPKHVPVPGRMCLYRAVTVLDSRRDRFAATTTDAGIIWYVLAQHYICAPGAAYVSSGSFGAMGMALPYAIGAAAARRRPVLAVTGDGSVMMSLSELATLRASGLPVLLVVNNNDGYVSIRSTHDRYFEGRKLGTDASNGVFIPNFEAIADSFELPYRAAHSESELAAALDELTGADLVTPAVLEIFTYVDQAVEPLVESRRLPDGTFASATLADMSPRLPEGADV